MSKSRVQLFLCMNFGSSISHKLNELNFITATFQTWQSQDYSFLLSLSMYHKISFFWGKSIYKYSPKTTCKSISYNAKIKNERLNSTYPRKVFMKYTFRMTWIYQKRKRHHCGTKIFSRNEICWECISLWRFVNLQKKKILLVEEKTR